MQLETFSYDAARGWSLPTLPPMDSPDTLVLCFGAARFADDPRPLRKLRETYPLAKLVGCSTSGEIHGTTVNDDSLAVAVARFEHAHLRTAFTEVHDAADSGAAGRELGEQLLADDLRGVFVLSDGLRVNGSELVRGINAALPAHVVVTGGLAGDGDRFGNTWSLADGAPRSGVVTAVGLYGDRVRIGHGSKGGWDIFGPERRVTRSEGNVLYELDGKPALALYKQYLGDRADGLPATGLLFPLALRSEQGDEKQLVRTILAVDEEQQSMTFAGDIPQGSLAQLMRANFDRLVDGAHDAARVTANLTGRVGDVLCVAISCVGRRLVLGERVEEEVEAVLDVLPRGTRQVGFYSYGELSPHTTGACDLHNQTMTLTTFSEDRAPS